MERRRKTFTSLEVTNPYSEIDSKRERTKHLLCLFGRNMYVIILVDEGILPLEKNAVEEVIFESHYFATPNEIIFQNRIFTQ